MNKEYEVKVTRQALIEEEPWRSEIEKAFTSETSRYFFHVKNLLELLEKHVKGEQDNSRKIWTVYMFLVWYQVYFVN